MQEPAGLLSIEDELDYFRGFPLGSGEFSLCNRIGCGVDQNRIPAQNSRALDAAIRSDNSFHPNHAMDVHLFCQFGVRRGDPGCDSAI